MAVQRLDQDYLNNRMPGNVANDIYKATHQGSLGGGSNGNLVTGKNSSGNYTDYNKSTGTVTYNLNGSTVFKPDSGSNTGDKTNTGSGNGGGSNGGGGGEYYYEGSGGGGYSDGGGGDGGGGGGYDYAAMIAEMLAMQRAAAQEAYDASKGRLDEAYANTYAALKSNLSSALSNLKKNYQFGEQTQRDDANKSLREAYINYMMNKRNLNQNLAAAGLSGGATESSLASLFNNYGNSRNNINTTLAKNLAELLNTYQNNVSSANQAYNSQDAEARMNYANNLNQLEQMLANNVMSSYSGSSLTSLANYAKTLADITGNMGAAMNVFTPTQNTLDVDTMNTVQGTDMGTITDYAKYLAMLEQMGQAI